MSYTFNGTGPQDFGKLFEPDTLLPDKFYATLRKRHHCDPERRLMAAVLEDVVACLSVDPSRCTGRQLRDLTDAEYWINAPYDSDWVFSFSSICEVLEIDPGYLKKGLNQWVMKYRDRACPALLSPKNRAGGRHKHFRLRAS